MSSYIINKDGYIIRPMMLKDVNNYLLNYHYSKEERNMHYRNYKTFIEKRTDEDSDLLFVVLKDNKIIGEISTQSLQDAPWDASVRIILPYKIEFWEDVKKVFVELCKDVFLYDNIYILPSRMFGKIEKVVIA